MNPSKVTRAPESTDRSAQCRLSHSRRFALTRYRAPSAIDRSVSICTLYRRLNQITGLRHDPCMLDTFISITRFMDGEPTQPWWHYTAERKTRLNTEKLS